MSKEEESIFADRRIEPRRPASAYHSVEINLGPPLPIYQFGLKDVSGKGMCIVVKGDSPILKHIRVGQVLDLKFYAKDQFRSNVTRQLTAEIRHITEGTPWHFEGSYLVGVAIREEA